MTGDGEPAQSAWRRALLVVFVVTVVLVVGAVFVWIAGVTKAPSALLAGLGLIAALLSLLVAGWAPKGAEQNQWGIARRDTAVWIGIFLGIAGAIIALAAWWFR